MNDGFYHNRWSFGIVLWEIFTLGGNPYPGLPKEQLLDYLREGQRMKQPHDCPIEMYDVMSDCWMQLPEQRPKFMAIAERIGNILERNISEVTLGSVHTNRFFIFNFNLPIQPINRKTNQSISLMTPLINVGVKVT